jgi:hypothetical protein
VRIAREKSNGNINLLRVESFNEWINCWGLLEVKDPSRAYTWSNNQEVLVMTTLDRVLAYVEW